MTMLVIMIPLTFAIVFSIARVVVLIYNAVNKYFYDKKITALKKRRDVIISQID